ncbi:MAG: efflux transporter outer membrane subunit [Planctomycetota bacterium]
MNRRWLIAALLSPLVWLTGCAPVGPDFVRPEAEIRDDWAGAVDEGLGIGDADLVDWWLLFEDPVLDQLVRDALDRNNSLELAGLSVLEARAQLGIATGLQYPQAQAAAGSATYVAPADNSRLPNSWSYSLGASAAWELDFWGRFRRGIESADAAYFASKAAYEQAQVILTSAVVDLYVVIRIAEEQLRIAEENVKLQQRSFDITRVLFENGADSELDVQQARTQLLSTQATIPGLEIGLAQARNALSTLLGSPPGAVDAALAGQSGIPSVPEALAIGVPADLLRNRPDVRQAELLAAAQSAQVGLATADLYPSFSLTGAIGLSAGGPGDSDFGDLFSSDALNRSAGISFVWPFLNYDRIENNIRVQDARLQQALVAYAETVIQAAREVEDSMAAYIGTQKQEKILAEAVDAAMRSNELSTLRYAEGYADFERVLRAQQALFSQQQRYISNQGEIVRSVISLYRSLGGGWSDETGLPFLDEATRQQMRERTDWGEMIDD